jgi:hypothetical protein
MQRKLQKNRQEDVEVEDIAEWTFTRELLNGLDSRNLFSNTNDN